MQFFKLLKLFFFSGFIVCGHLAHSQLRIIEFSDTHSAYDRLPLMINSIAGLATKETVIIVNGDFGGVSPWSIDRGELGIDVLSALAKEFPVLYVIGNHDGLDWGNSTLGNQLAVDQIKALDQAGVIITGANYKFSEPLKNLISPHYDSVTKSGRKTRFVGLGLETIFNQSNMDQFRSPQIISKVEDAQKVMLDKIREADHSQVDDLILFQHEGYKKLREDLKKIHSRKVNIPVAFAGHDHLQHNKVVNGIRLVDSGSQGDFSVVDLDSKGKVTSVEFFDEQRQLELKNSQVISLNLKRLSIDVQKYLTKVKSKLSKVVGRSGGTNENKQNLKSGPSRLGTAVADAFRVFGLKNATAKPVVAFYNSSSYRRDEPIPEGALTVETVLSVYPFKGAVKAFEVTGSEMEILYKSVRAFAIENSQSHSPQLSQNASEGEGMTLLIDQKPVVRNQKYLLVMDEWLSRNGYKLKEFEEILNGRSPLVVGEVDEILLQFLPRSLERAFPVGSGCSSYLEP